MGPMGPTGHEGVQGCKHPESPGHIQPGMGCPWGPKPWVAPGPGRWMAHSECKINFENRRLQGLLMHGKLAKVLKNVAGCYARDMLGAVYMNTVGHVHQLCFPPSTHAPFSCSVPEALPLPPTTNNWVSKEFRCSRPACKISCLPSRNDHWSNW